MSDEQREAAEAGWREAADDAVYDHRNRPFTVELLKAWFGSGVDVGWDAAMAAKAEPVQIDRAEIRATLKGAGVEGRLLDEAEAAVWKFLAAQPVTGTVEFMLRVPGEIPSGAVRATRDEILADKAYVEARWGKREAVQRTVSEWVEVN